MGSLAGKVTLIAAGAGTLGSVSGAACAEAGVTVVETPEDDTDHASLLKSEEIAALRLLPAAKGAGATSGAIVPVYGRA